MDKETLKEIHREASFLRKCKKLEQQIAEAEELFNKLPPLDELTDPKERFKWLDRKQHLEKLKATLRITIASHTCDKYEKEGLFGIPTNPPLEPGQ